MAQSAELYRDVLRSGLVSSAQVVVLFGANLVLYRLLIGRGQLDVLGLYALLRAVPILFAALELGIALSLMRNSSPHASAELRALARQDAQAGVRCFAFGGVLILLATPLLLALAGQRYPAGVYAPLGLGFALLGVLASGALTLVASMDAAVLAARMQNAYVAGVRLTGVLVLYATTLTCAWWGRPLEGLALGSLLAATLQLLAFRRWLDRVDPAWWGKMPACRWRETPARLVGAARRGGGLYALSLALAIRRPLLMATVGLSFGLHQVALVEIALQAVSALWSLFGAAAQALFPAFSGLRERGDLVETRRLMVRSILATLLLGMPLLIAINLFAEPLLRLALAEVPPGLGPILHWLSIWLGTSLLIMPGTQYLQSVRREKALAALVGCHILTLLAFGILGVLGVVSLGGFILSWSLIGVGINIALVAMVYRLLATT